MKIRNGFVSNSSSSSFVVAFDKVPTSAKEMKKILFRNEKEFKNPYFYPEERDSIFSWPAEDVSEIAFNDMKEISDEEAMQVVRSGYHEEYADLDDFRVGDGDGWNYDWDRYTQTNDKVAQKIFKEFRKQHPNEHLFTFTYIDSDGPLATAMEHGNLFGRVPHIYISQH